MSNRETKNLTVKMPSRLLVPTITEMPPGTAWFIDPEAVWVDKETWQTFINSAYPINDESITDVRLINFGERLVLDLTPHDPFEQPQKFFPTDFRSYAENCSYLPDCELAIDTNAVPHIVGFLALQSIISTQKELDKVTEEFVEQFGVTLEGANLESKNESLNLTKKKKKGKKTKQLNIHSDSTIE